MSDLRDKLVFTSDWVSSHCDTWAGHLSHLAGKPGVRGIEIGMFEGRSTLWWLERILTGEGSKLYAFEPWREKIQPNLAILREMGFDEHRLQVFFERAQTGLVADWVSPEMVDFAYIDGGKDADQVLQNSVLVWLALKPGGVIIWDDYRWEWREGVVSPYCEHPPKIGIDAFLAAHVGKYEELHRGWQVVIRKNA